ncbi:phage tail tape measure protein [uncultured Fibrobacter sp.]|uniref:phage tail tape measure protein n=1 Tax=uncultured Fibrobacter sp. TaxID=261512 RepID=UPI0025FB009E|nr:phage tail tape measure protein [uncultured Fibrobacter sp.]MBR2470105.1 phage tail tape measure protein [Fibrobacter sp.]
MANNEVTLRIGADATGLQNGLRQSSTAVSSFGTKARATIARVGGSMRGLADRMVTPFNSLVLGGGLGMAVKNVGDLSESLMYYGFAAKKSDADTKVFRESLHKTAIETGVAANEILNGVSKIGEITGQFDFAEEMGPRLAKAAKASGASMEDLANVASSLKVTMGLTADEVSKFFNSLIIQGDQGSYTLQKFAAEGKALLATTSTHGIKTAEQFASFGGYLQVMNSQIKSEAELTTSVSALFSELASKAKDLNKIGVHVVDKNREFNDFDAIMRQLMDKTKGDILKLGKFFGASSMKALMPIITEYKNGWETLDTITKSGQEGMTNTKVLDERFQKTANDFNSNVDKMKAVALQFADTNLTGPVEQLTTALGFLSRHQGIVTAGFKMMAVAAAALGMVKIGGLVKDVAGLARDIKGIWSKKGGAGASAAGTGASALDASVQKVFVVNMRSGFGGGSDYMDDDVPMYQPATQKAAQAMESTTKEVGRFRQGLSTARAGLNKFGSSVIGGTLMTAATGWAMNQIYNFGQAFMEWRNVVADVEANSRAMVDRNQAEFEKRYGPEAARWSKKHGDTLLEIQKEENSFLPSQKKLDKLYGDLRLYNQLTKNAVAAQKGDKMMSPQEYMQALNQNIIINVDSNGKAVVETDKGKPPKVSGRKTTPGWGA